MFSSLSSLLIWAQSLVELGDDSVIFHVEFVTINKIRAQRVIVGSSSSIFVCSALGDQAVITCGHSFSRKGWPALRSRFMGPYTVRLIIYPYYALKSDSAEATRKGIHVHRSHLFGDLNYSIVNFINNFTIK